LSICRWPCLEAGLPQAPREGRPSLSLRPGRIRAAGPGPDVGLRSCRGSWFKAAATRGDPLPSLAAATTPTALIWKGIAGSRVPSACPRIGRHDHADLRVSL